LLPSAAAAAAAAAADAAAKLNLGRGVGGTEDFTPFETQNQWSAKSTP
jgi:hypothetical protein